MKSFLRRTWAKIDLDAIEHNYNEIRNHVSPESEIMCVIKADGYGHGAIFLAREYERLGVKRFAVSNIEEAMQLREHGIKSPILILGFTPADLAKVLADNNISQAVLSEEYAEELSKYAQRDSVTVKAHIALDTGMSRIGFMYQNIDRDFASIDMIERVCKLPSLYFEGIFTHFFVSDEAEEGKEDTLCQYKCFDDAIAKLSARGIEFPLRHCANSGAIIDYPDTHINMVRAGIILYGLAPSGKLEGKLNLIPAMQLKSVIAQIKTVEPDAKVSYGGTFTTSRPTKIATVPIGYADGYTRALGNNARMIVNGKYAPIIGRVCMDQLMLDITDIENVSTGDEVTVIGTDGDCCVSAEEIANLTDTINYEIICIIGKRVPRVYFKNGKNVGTLDYIYPSNLKN